MKRKNLISAKKYKIISFTLSLVFIAENTFLPLPALAQTDKGTNKLLINKKEYIRSIEKTNENVFHILPKKEKKIDKLPENENKVVKSAYYTITAYNSEPGQTDDSPCITANGFNVCKHGIEDTIAANFLSFGTKVKIPELFGDRVFIVRDRMNRRYQSRVDVWMLEKQDALNLGRQIAKIEILKN